MNNQVVTALEQARALIEAGWCQKATKQILKGRTEYDLMGALYEATLNQSGVTNAVYLAAKSAVIAALPEGHDYPTQFNDHPDTTQADVAAVFQRAAASVGVAL